MVSIIDFYVLQKRPSNGGGFDIAIGNPPYISAPTQIASPELNEQRQRIVASKKYKSLNEKWDLYVPSWNLVCSSMPQWSIFYDSPISFDKSKVWKETP